MINTRIESVLFTEYEQRISISQGESDDTIVISVSETHDGPTFAIYLTYAEMRDFVNELQMRADMYQKAIDDKHIEDK